MNDDILQRIRNMEEVVWINDKLQSASPQSTIAGIRYGQVMAAQSRLLRYMPFIESAFPETQSRKGVIESNLLPTSYPGNVFVKDDAHLPIAGSVKARGGIYEVLKHAEDLALSNQIFHLGDDYARFDSDEFRAFFHDYTVQVGSTGNLGLSIGIISASLGFNVIVHMSSDAKQWKKDLLRENGVTVKEYDGDYCEAVAKGRRLSEEDPKSYFVDDENSMDLFLGYSTAALRLKVQLYKAGIQVDSEHPLFVYLPCGVGGAPGGITFGLKQMYGDDVHCFFAEPTGAPCFTLGMSTEQKNEISIQDIGLSGETIADGLAVGRASGLVCKVMDNLVSGSFTVTDEHLLKYQEDLEKREGIFIEPSACAGIHGITELQNTPEFQRYIDNHGLAEYMKTATHIIWATGGGLMPR